MYINSEEPSNSSGPRRVVELIVAAGGALWRCLIRWLRSLFARGESGPYALSPVINPDEADSNAQLTPGGDLSPTVQEALMRATEIFSRSFDRVDPLTPLLMVHGIHRGIDPRQPNVLAWRMQGIHANDYRGISRTGQKVTLDGATLVVLGDGTGDTGTGVPAPVYKTYFNELDVLAQLGVIHLGRPMVSETVDDGG
jgi:hypothetical protein